MRDENINPSAHTQTAHSPEGRNLQMALSYVWLLIKPSHLSLPLSLSAAQLYHSSSCLIPPSLPEHHSHCLSHTQIRTHFPKGAAYIQVSPRALIRVSLILSSDLKLSVLVHLWQLNLDFYLTLSTSTILSLPSTVWSTQSSSTFTPELQLLPFLHGFIFALS